VDTVEGMMMMKRTVEVDATTRSRVIASEEEDRQKKGSVLIIRGNRVKETLELRKNFEYTILTK
jgi:hypothetical protein